MHADRIAELLEPFLRRTGDGSTGDQRLTTNDLTNISTYIDLLLRWNARINLTAIRNEEEIVTRHFGESLFTARHLFPARQCKRESPRSCSLIDVGSGAGFPGLPIKLWTPDLALTLIESLQKKATFLREAARQLTLTDINVFSGRAENYPGPVAEVVTLRAVERFDTTLPIAARLVAPSGRIALLIGKSQLASAHTLTPQYSWAPPIAIPLSSSRVLAVGILNPQPGLTTRTKKVKSGTASG